DERRQSWRIRRRLAHTMTFRGKAASPRLCMCEIEHGEWKTRTVEMSEITLDGQSLTLESVFAVARNQAHVKVAANAKIRVERSRAVVDKLLVSKVPVYGLNTGFGSLRDVHIDTDQARELQRNLIRSHCCGVGEPATEDVTRAMMLLRANTLAKG